MRRFSLFGIRAGIFVFLLWSPQLWTPYRAQPQPTSPLIKTSRDHFPLSEVSDFSEVTDFYYYQEKKILLHRSPTEAVVQFKAELEEHVKQQLMQALTLAETSISTFQGEGRTLAIIISNDPAQLDSLIGSLQEKEEILFVFPVLRTLETGARMLLTDEIIVKVKPGQPIQAILSLFPAGELTVIKTVWGTVDEYVIGVRNPKIVNPLTVANTLVESGLVIWAEPNFTQEYQHSYTPNDPLYPHQWNLHNTGQGGGKPNADVDAPEAWNLQQGNASVTIAIIDDGVETSHEDLVANLFTNPREIAGNGLDDDGNGLIDDVHGWDFANNDNDPSPSSPNDKHGTVVAGVAAARGDNAIGISGMCPKCKILPIKLSNPDSTGKFTIDEATIAATIRYAASLADVVNGSWAGENPSSVIRPALQDALTIGRGGKGAIPLFAAGNSGSGFKLMGPLPLPAGTHRFRWIYTKNESDVLPTGADTAWLAWVVFPGSQLVDFETSPGWTKAGNAPWLHSADPTHADEGFCFTHAMKAGAITHNQSSILQVVRTVPAGTITFRYWVESEIVFDGLQLVIDLNNDGSDDLSTQLLSGQALSDFHISYPAVYPEAIAVGASSEFDCRASYSSIGPELDFVAPGGFSAGIYTTDRTGIEGYAIGNYRSSFAGTSAATPLAAGVAALILAHNPHLTQSQVRQLMQTTADTIGPEPSGGGRNDRYGYGRINAARALSRPLPVGYLENPQPASSQSGISLVSGWVCNANEVILEFDGVRTFQAAYGTSREDAKPICGDSNNGFGFLWNWNLLGSGTHTARIYDDGVQFADVTFTVTTFGQEFLRGVSGRYPLPGFPQPGVTTDVRWQESAQNFFIEGVQ